MTVFGRKEFADVFRVGEIVPSGAVGRKNAADLRILAIEEELVRYQSVASQSQCLFRYPYLQHLIKGYAQLDPKSIQKSVNRILKDGGFKPNYSTENYAYTFARAFHERIKSELFLTGGETPAEDPSTSFTSGFAEGRRVAVMIERIERDSKARQACIQHFGAWCQVCGFDFEIVYGAIGKGYIHVHHHRKQLSDTSGTHAVDPIADLIPLCPNCHAMAHSKNEMRSIETLRRLIADTIGY